MYLYYLRIQCVPRSKHITSVIKPDVFMLYNEKLWFDLKSLQNTQRQCDHHVHFLNVKPGDT